MVNSRLFMKIVHIIGSKSSGGAERFFLRFSRACCEAGHENYAFLRKNTAILSHVAQGIQITTFPMANVWDMVSIYLIRKRLKSLIPHVVQTYMGRATRLTRLPGSLTHTIHVARLGGYYKLNGYRHADAWVCNTLSLCDYLLKSGFDSRRVYYIPNFVDEPITKDENKIHELRKCFGIPEHALVLLNAGRFMEVKGHRYLLQAFAHMKKEAAGRPIYLVLLGNGPLFEEIRSMASSLGVANRVIFAGWQSEPGHFYHLADVVVFPSLETEALGNVILEAWSYERPVISSSFPGALELITDGENGLRVPCRNVQQLTKTIYDLCLDSDLRVNLAQKGRERLLRDFSKKRIMSDYFQMYSELMQKKYG